MEDIQFYRHQALEMSQVDINVLCKLWRTATLIAHTTCSKQKHQTECPSQKKRLHVVKARICRDLFMQTFNQSGQDQQSDDTAGKKGIEVRVQKIKKESQSMHFFFSERQNIVRFIVNHVEMYIAYFLGTCLITGDLRFRGKKKNCDEETVYRANV